MKKSIQCLVFFVLFASCKSTDNLNSAPELNSSNRKEVNLISEVTVEKARTPSAAGNSYAHLSAEDKTFIDGIFNDIINKIKDPVAFDSIARTAVMLGSMGMKLMAAFDLKIEKLANSPQPTEKDLNYIKTDITCQLWESSVIQHRTQDKVTYLQTLLLQNKNEELYKRFLNLFISGKNDKPGLALAKANILRVIQWNHENYCRFVSCPSFQVSQTSHDFPFDLFSDIEMANYYKKNKTKIGFYENLKTAKDELIGSCFDYPNKRKPNQNQDKDYNWQKRSHTGRELKEHEFIVTYDDGPHAEYTQKIADSWAKSGFKLPTFFWLTKNIIAYPQIAMNLLTNNFPIGLHSYTHADLGNLSSAANIAKLNSVNKKNFAGELKKVTDATFNSWRNGKLKNEIVTAKSEYEAIINKYEPGRNFKIKHFRLPFGSGMKNPEIGKLLEQTNMEHYFWAIDSLDWNDKNPLTIKERVLTQMTINKKGIILFHDIHKQSSLATIELINHFKDNSNLKVVSINDLNKP